jgi:hypothetical protein
MTSGFIPSLFRLLLTRIREEFRKGSYRCLDFRHTIADALGNAVKYVPAFIRLAAALRNGVVDEFMRQCESVASSMPNLGLVDAKG